tara:strand:- start:669 stop:1406 length:738 start_codon:yes stop_codon:yes gene_type:complete
MNQNNKYYLTENIFRLKNKLYFEDEHNKIKLNRNNWYKFLKDYGWEKISKQWKKKLDVKKNYFAFLDCGGNGDCLFHCISEALNEPYNLSSELIDTQYLRNIAAEQINQDNFTLILENYKIEKENNEFQGYWDPFIIKTKEQLKKEIQTCGNNFWGDHILLQLIQKKLNINIILFKTNIYDILSEENEGNIEIQFLDENKDITIMLYYISEMHYQLIGYFDGNLILTKFNKKQIPDEIKKIINLD